MSRRAIITATYTRHTAKFAGATKNVLILHAERAGTVWQWMPGRGELGELHCPQQRGADIEASLTTDGYVVMMALDSG